MRWSRRLLLPAVFGLGILLSLSPTANAQKGHSSGGRSSAPSASSPGRGSVAHTGSSVHHANPSVHYNNSFYRYPLYPGYSYLQPYNYGYYDPLYRPSYYPPIYDSSPLYYAVPPMMPAEPIDQSARIEVLLPAPDAQVWLDGNKTSSVGAQRVFASPVLAPGNYAYEVTAVWKQDGQDVRVVRTIQVAPGRTSVVDFTRVSTADKTP